jgi:hypothetical protein
MRRCVPSLRPAAFPPPSPPPISVGFVRCFNGTTQPSDPSSVPRQLRLLDFLSRPGIAQATAGQTRSPRFRRDPFVRDVASDPGRATVPRVTAPHMLPSAVATASAPATSRISWLNPTPQTITVYASPWSSPSTTQHSLPGGRYPFPGPDFHRLDRASFAWRTATQSSDSPHLRARKHQRVDNDIAEVRAIRRSPNAAPCACSRLRPPSSGIGATNGGRLSWRFMPALVSSMIIPSIL